MKFERGQDIRQTLEIGMEESLQEFLSSVSQPTYKREHQLLVSVTFGKTEFVEYLININTSPTSEMLRIAINREWKDIISLIVDVNPGLKRTLSITKYKWSKMKEEIKELIR